MTDWKKILGIGLLLIIGLGILTFVIAVGVAGLKLRSVASSPCNEEPVLIDGQQVATITALQLATGHTFTPDEISNLGLTTCDGGICSTTCPAVTP